MVSALIAAAVLIATIFGVLESVPTWLRGIVQALGTLAGVYLGSMLQYGDQRSRLEAVGDTAVSHLAALARSITLMIDHVGRARVAVADGTPKNIASVQLQTETLLDGIDVQLRGVLTQAEAAARSWQPYSPEYDTITRGNGTVPEGSDV